MTRARPAPPSPMRAVLLPAMLGALLAGCVATPVKPPAAPPPPPAPPAIREPGLERVMGRTARELVALFGQPDQERREAAARRLQFAGPACVLDAYLYPPASGGGEPVVTWIDARTRAGDDMDRASCVAALARR